CILHRIESQADAQVDCCYDAAAQIERASNQWRCQRNAVDLSWRQYVLSRQHGNSENLVIDGDRDDLTGPVRPGILAAEGDRHVSHAALRVVGRTRDSASRRPSRSNFGMYSANPTARPRSMSAAAVLADNAISGMSRQRSSRRIASANSKPSISGI